MVATAVLNQSRAGESRKVTAKPVSASIPKTKEKLTRTAKVPVATPSTRAMATATITTMSVAVVTTAATAVNKRSMADRSRQVTAKPASASIRNTKQTPEGTANVLKSVARRSTKA